MPFDRYYGEEASVAEDDLLASDAPVADSIERLRGPFMLGHVAGLVRKIQSLPAMPETVIRVREVSEDPASSIGDVVKVITLDPPVAAKVLSVANSAAYGFPMRIHDINLAVSLLGLRETYAIVPVGCRGRLRAQASKCRLPDLLARLHVLRGRGARFVTKASGRRHLAGVFSAGLLHDIGRAVLWEVAPELTATLDSGLAGLALVKAEEQVLGVSHNEAGYRLAEDWNLPP